jgi:hypothetical protein
MSRAVRLDSERLRRAATWAKDRLQLEFIRAVDTDKGRRYYCVLCSSITGATRNSIPHKPDCKFSELVQACNEGSDGRETASP